ncbi:EamA family transporter [Paenibacillus sedimenti]
MPVINSLSHISLKYGTTRQKKISKLLFLLIGYSGFIVVTVLSTYILKFIELKSLTTVLALNYIFVLFFASVLLKEKLNLNIYIGTIFILLGVVVFNL